MEGGGKDWDVILQCGYTCMYVSIMGGALLGIVKHLGAGSCERDEGGGGGDRARGEEERRERGEEERRGGREEGERGEEERRERGEEERREREGRKRGGREGGGREEGERREEERREREGRKSEGREREREKVASVPGSFLREPGTEAREKVGS